MKPVGKNVFENNLYICNSRMESVRKKNSKLICKIVILEWVRWVKKVSKLLCKFVILEWSPLGKKFSKQISKFVILEWSPLGKKVFKINF